jgi:hypothetical protein
MGRPWYYTSQYGPRLLVGVLDTPCFPARYYGGLIRQDVHGHYFPECNDTFLFHRTEEEARKDAFKQFPSS